MMISLAPLTFAAAFLLQPRAPILRTNVLTGGARLAMSADDEGGALASPDDSQLQKLFFDGMSEAEQYNTLLLSLLRSEDESSRTASVKLIDEMSERKHTLSQKSLLDLLDGALARSAVHGSGRVQGALRDSVALVFRNKTRAG